MITDAATESAGDGESKRHAQGRRSEEPGSHPAAHGFARLRAINERQRSKERIVRLHHIVTAHINDIAASQSKPSLRALSASGPVQNSATTQDISCLSTERATRERRWRRDRCEEKRVYRCTNTASAGNERDRHGRRWTVSS